MVKPYIIVRAKEVPERKQQYIVPNKEYVCFDVSYGMFALGAGRIMDEDGMSLVILLGQPCAHLDHNIWEIVDD